MGAIIESTKPSYAKLSARPAHMLVFLLPLIALYEVGASVYLRDPQRLANAKTIRAYDMLEQSFAIVGAAGLHLPGLLIIAVLLIWHIMLRESWAIRPRVLAGMLAESVCWTFPLLVLAYLLAAILGASSAGAAETAASFAAMPWPAKATIAIGAGLYEELLFRLFAVTMLHAVLHDLLAFKDRTASVLAVVLAAVMFALYHNNAWSTPTAIEFAYAGYFFVLGLSFGTLYTTRGFAIAATVHAFTDIALFSLEGG